jgi:hypothetical protein
VAGHEHDAAPHERGDGIVCGRKGAGRVLEVGGICGGRFLLFDQGIGLELPTRLTDTKTDTKTYTKSPSRELTADELARVSAGYLVFAFMLVAVKTVG